MEANNLLSISDMCLSFLLISAMELALALEKLVNEKLHNLHGVSCILAEKYILRALLKAYIENLWANIS